MKFFSRNANLRVILKPGIPSDALGHAAIPAVSVRFEDGMVEVKDEEVLKMLMNPDKGYGTDFVAGDNSPIDPFSRVGSEPEHDIMNIEYGRVAKNLNPKPVAALSPEMKKAVEKMAFDVAKEMAAKMAAEMVTNFVKQNAEAAKKADSTVSEDNTQKIVGEIVTPNVKVPDETADIADASDVKTVDSKPKARGAAKK